MCGIVGILNLAEAPPPEETLVRSMLGMIRHRGPDQFGLYLGAQVALGNARLSIIDLGGGQQPIGNEDQTLWIVYNGEIYNYVELRAELEARGHRFVTHTDTEVILHLYEDLGPECLSRLNGQWALAIWSERDRSLFLARDRLGVRPLFHTEIGGRLVFGSEIKAIFADPTVRRALDPVGLDQVFTFWGALAPRTCFEGIRELPPGHYLLARNGATSIRPYWRLKFGEQRSDERGRDLSRGDGSGRMANGEPTSVEAERDCPLSELRAPSSELPTPSSPAAWAAELRSLLTDAVRVRLRADVPVGAYLSGGLDSSLIAAMIRELGVSHLDTFSIAFSDPEFDESEHQERMARFLGTDHQVVRATHEEIGRVFPEVVWHAETALMRTAPAPMFLLSRLVRQRQYKVVLTGEGADEFLAGYDIFKEAKVRRFWARQPESKWRPLLLQRLYPDIADLNAAGVRFLTSFFGAGLSDTDDPFYSHAVRWRNTRRCARFFGEQLATALRSPSFRLRPEGFGGQAVVPPSLSSLLSPGAASWGPLERAQYLEITTFLSAYLLSSQGDRMGMANSVEGRFPFLDHRVVDFCSRLPSRLKLRALRDKHLLREAAKSMIPDAVLSRPKRPYRAPIHRSLFNADCRDYVRELLSEEAVALAGLFRPSAVARLAAKAAHGDRIGETDGMALVGILSSQLLHRQFVAGFQLGRPVGAADDVKVADRRGLFGGSQGCEVHGSRL